MKRAATPAEINQAFEDTRTRLARPMTFEEIQTLDASLARPIERDTSQANHKLDTDSQVFFYEQDYYVLSNFSAFCVHYDNAAHFTSEHAYHWARFSLPDGRGRLLQDCVQRCSSAHAAFKFAQENKSKQREDWDAVKLGIMREILFAKVDQHEYVRRKLLATGDRELVEDSWRDGYWGWGADCKGQNVLGRLWMEVRASLRGESVTYLESVTYRG